MPRAKKTAVSASAAANTSEKKTTTRKTCKVSICLELPNLSVTVTDIQNAVKKAVKEEGIEASDIKIYIKAEEHAVYYTVNGEGGNNRKIDLDSLK